jgi:hypothetical protein
MDMSNVKNVYDANAQKNVKKIQDADGNIVWYKVPDGYTKLQRLEFNGSQYVRTDVTPASNPTITVIAAVSVNLHGTAFYPTVICDRKFSEVPKIGE